MEVITNIMRWAAYANVCDVCVFCCCCVGAAGVPTTHILYGIPRYVDFQIIHTDSFIEFGICPFPQIKKSSPQNKHQTWKHLEIGEHVTPENIIHWIRPVTSLLKFIPVRHPNQVRDEFVGGTITKVHGMDGEKPWRNCRSLLLLKSSASLHWLLNYCIKYSYW